MKTLYLAEVYLNNPRTGERGWEIQFYWLTAFCREFAIARLVDEIPLFDTLIQLTEQSERFELAGCEAIELG